MATMQQAFLSLEEVTPFQFSQRTCVMLNNIEWAQEQFINIEHVIDSEKQSAALTRKRQKESATENNTSGSYWFTVLVKRAINLPACDTNGLSDPYLVVMDGRNSELGRTQTIYETLDPFWERKFEIERRQSEDSMTLPLKIWDANSYTDDTLCGEAVLNLSPDKYTDFVPVEKWLEVTPKGKLLVTVTMESEMDDICYYFGKSLRRLTLAEDEMMSMMVAKVSSLINLFVSKNTLNSLLGVKGYKSYFTDIFRTQQSQDGPIILNEDTVAASLDPLFDYLNDTFKTFSQTLSLDLRNNVMMKTWYSILEALESLLMPPLSDKKTSQVRLNDTELMIVKIWSDSMLHFFHNDGNGVPMVELKSTKYNSYFIALTSYYSASTEELKKECADKALDSIMTLIKPTAALNITPKRKTDDSKLQTEHEPQLKVASSGDPSNSIASFKNQVELRKPKRVNSIVEQSKELEELLLRLLRGRGEYEFVTRILNQKTNLAVSAAI